MPCNPALLISGSLRIAWLLSKYRHVMISCSNFDSSRHARLSRCDRLTGVQICNHKRKLVNYGTWWLVRHWLVTGRQQSRSKGGRQQSRTTLLRGISVSNSEFSISRSVLTAENQSSAGFSPEVSVATSSTPKMADLPACQRRDPSVSLSTLTISLLHLLKCASSGCDFGQTS